MGGLIRSWNIFPYERTVVKRDLVGAMSSEPPAISTICCARGADVAAYDALYQRLIRRVDLADVPARFVMQEVKDTTVLSLDYVG